MGTEITRMARTALVALMALVAGAFGEAVQSIEADQSGPGLPIELGRHTIDTAIQDVTAMEKKAQQQSERAYRRAQTYVARHVHTPTDPLVVAQATIKKEEEKQRKKEKAHWDSLDKIVLDPLTPALEAVDKVAKTPVDVDSSQLPSTL